jgi:hypothetical protein
MERARARGCTDTPCLLLFAGALAALAYIYSLALERGDVAALARASDWSWDVCGEDNTVAATGLPLRTNITLRAPGHALPFRDRLPRWLGGGDGVGISVPDLRGGRDLRARPLLFYLLPPLASASAPAGIGICVARCPEARGWEPGSPAPAGWPCADDAAAADADDGGGAPTSAAANQTAAIRAADATAATCRVAEAAEGPAGTPECAAPLPAALRACAAPDQPCGLPPPAGAGRVCAPAYASVPLLNSICLPTDAAGPALALTVALEYDRARASADADARPAPHASEATAGAAAAAAAVAEPTSPWARALARARQAAAKAAAAGEGALEERRRAHAASDLDPLRRLQSLPRIRRRRRAQRRRRALCRVCGRPPRTWPRTGGGWRGTASR